MLPYFWWGSGALSGAGPGKVGTGQWAQGFQARATDEIVQKHDVEPLSVQPGTDPEAQ